MNLARSIVWKNRSSQLLKRIPYEKFALHQANFDQKVYEKPRASITYSSSFWKGRVPKDFLHESDREVQFRVCSD